MADKKKSRITLTFKLNALVLAIIIILAGGLAAIAYQVNSQRVDQYFKQTTAQDASAVAVFMDGDYLQALLDAMQSEEFSQVRAAALTAENEEMIRDWLDRHGLYGRFCEMTETLKTYQQTLNVRFIYIFELDV